MSDNPSICSPQDAVADAISRYFDKCHLDLGPQPLECAKIAIQAYEAARSPDQPDECGCDPNGYVNMGCKKCRWRDALIYKAPKREIGIDWDKFIKIEKIDIDKDAPIYRLMLWVGAQGFQINDSREEECEMVWMKRMLIKALNNIPNTDVEDGQSDV